MSPKDAARALDEVARELDLLAYRLERSAPSEPEAAAGERKRMHRDLESLRERVEDLARALG